ncbi:MAG: iron-containing alcohol dehydrogenase [Synergistaceae bacterium]|jgi:3-deoxy-alpha-D-manno-octulosonate 8-oxidase|nr:iron-containing alcohol dehydrogenase [Synergistaceae bacterium]
MKDMLDSFVRSPRWWRTEIPTQIVLSKDGIGDLFALLEKEKKRPFFILDSALSAQEKFKPVLERGKNGQSNSLFLFEATASEPRTGDVDALVKTIRERGEEPDVFVGIGGGGTMDLAKAVGICLKNPKSAADYQGWGFDMARGADVWVVPTLNGTGAELTPIAVLRGPQKKLGINTPLVAPRTAVVDPQLSEGARKFNRFYTMMDCYFHHYEITLSKTSAPDAILDAEDGLKLSRSVLSRDLSEYGLETAIQSAKGSILGGSSTIGGRVGASHAISYGLSNASPTLPHSVAVTISMLGLAGLYRDGGYDETLRFLEINSLPVPRAKDYGIDSSHVEKMVKTALGMDKLWLSHFGEGWEKAVTEDFLRDVYTKIVTN